MATPELGWARTDPGDVPVTTGNGAVDEGQEQEEDQDYDDDRDGSTLELRKRPRLREMGSEIGLAADSDFGKGDDGSLRFGRAPEREGSQGGF